VFELRVSVPILGVRWWQDILNAESRSRRARVVTQATQASAGESMAGVQHALRRLETAEVVTYDLLQDALRSGDPVAIRHARESWLKVGDSLRHYDLQIEASRRDNGELVPREQVERAAASLVHFLKLSIRQRVYAIAPQLVGMQSPADVSSILVQSLFDDVLTALAAMG
jgi:hypothetical protein